MGGACHETFTATERLPEFIASRIPRYFREYRERTRVLDGKAVWCISCPMLSHSMIHSQVRTTEYVAPWIPPNNHIPPTNNFSFCHFFLWQNDNFFSFLYRFSDRVQKHPECFSPLTVFFLSLGYAFITLGRFSGGRTCHSPSRSAGECRESEWQRTLVSYMFTIIRTVWSAVCSVTTNHVNPVLTHIYIWHTFVMTDRQEYEWTTTRTYRRSRRAVMIKQEPLNNWEVEKQGLKFMRPVRREYKVPRDYWKLDNQLLLTVPAPSGHVVLSNMCHWMHGLRPLHSVVAASNFLQWSVNARQQKKHFEGNGHQGED